MFYFVFREERLGYILRISQKGEQDSRNKGERERERASRPRGKGKVCVLELKLEDQVRSGELKLSQITLIHHIAQPAKKKGDSGGWRLCKPVLELLELPTITYKPTEEYSKCQINGSNEMLPGKPPLSTRRERHLT